MTETQKAIEAESDVYAKYDPFGDYKHLSISERSRLISAKTQAYMAGHIAGRSKSLEEKEKEISDLREDLAEQTKVIRKQLEVIDNLGNESKRLKELIRVWWLIANRIKPQEAEQMLGAKEFIDYMRSVESMYNKFKTENNL